MMLPFLLISRNESKRKNIFKYLFFGMGFLTLIIAEILVRYSGKSYAYSYIYYFAPLISVPLLYYILLLQFNNENKKRVE